MRREGKNDEKQRIGRQRAEQAAGACERPRHATNLDRLGRLPMGILLLGWLFFAIVTAAIASGKGRSGFGWLLIGLLLGIFGVILIACMPRKEILYDEPQRLFGSTRRAKLKKCPDCAEHIRADAKVCRHCGFRFDQPAGGERREPRLS
jgi:hypothetical protein